MEPLVDHTTPGQTSIIAPSLPNPIKILNYIVFLLNVDAT